MNALHRKLIRDLWQMRGQMLAISLVMACGVATFVMALSTLQSLRRTQQTYYERYRFAQVFTSLKRAPQALADRIAAIPGVVRVQTRVVEHATLDVAGLAEPAVGRLVSIPERPGPGLNELYLRRGRYIEPGRTGEVLVSEGFATAHRLHPGDSIRAVINGRRHALRIVGIALSPEYIYAIRAGDLLPDDHRFGIVWMGHTDVAAAFDMQGAFNDLCLTVMPGTSEADVLRRLDRLTAPYGGLGAYGRAEQSSHKFLANELKELRGMALVVPSIFLGVAAFLLHIVLSRLVDTQREHIAALKAFGYTRWEVGGHYLEMAVVMVLLGAVIGTAAGVWLGRSVTALYTRFFHFPLFTFALGSDVLLLALGISGTAAILGTLAAVRRAVGLPPAAAMRPEPPASYQPTVLERMGVQRWLSPGGRMIVRHLGRRPWRALLSCVGIALALAMLILGSFMKDALDFALESQFYLAQRQDLSIAFVEPASASALHDVAHLPDVRRCEPFRSLSVRLRAGPRSRRVGLLGVHGDGQLFRLLDIGRRAIAVPSDGVILSAKLGELLDVTVGAPVVVEVLEGERPVREVLVAGLIADFEGTAAYMDIGAVHRLMQESAVLSGAFLAVDTQREEALYRTLKHSARIASVTIKGAALRSFQRTVAENLLRMRAFNILFASIIAFGVVYNSARISLAERSRELATLRVIGFTRGEISLLLLGEFAVLTLAAIPVGVALGYGLAAVVIHLAYDTELFRIPLIVHRWTYGFAVTVILLAALLSGLMVRRLLDRLDLVAVLKSKE
jgi:putative ABC transport system permease protein